MLTLKRLVPRPETVPAGVAYHLAELGELRGQVGNLGGHEALREEALVESLASSARLDGLEVDPGRLPSLVYGNPLLLGPAERELHGLLEAFRLVSAEGKRLPLTTASLRRLARHIRGRGRGAGAFKSAEAELEVAEALALARECLAEPWPQALLGSLALGLDLLMLDPFNGAAGRLSRAVQGWLVEATGFAVGAYVSIPRLVEDSRERFQATLVDGSWGDPWPYAEYMLVVLKTAYLELERRLDRPGPKTKSELIEAAVESAEGRFTRAGLVAVCPGVTDAEVRTVLERLKREGKVVSLGRGPGAPWRRA